MAALIVGACAVAVTWVFLVPIYQGPDEIANDDYSFSIFRAGHLLNVRDLPPGTAHPYTTYLADRSGGERMPFHPQVKAPPGYGTSDFYRELDAGAPSVSAPATRAPYLVSRYPFGYFALVAAWLAVVSLFAGSGPVALFFAARLLSVVMLAGSLALTYGIAREFGLKRLRSLALTAAIGFFPLTSFVASYAQTDNLSWLLVSAALFLALRTRRQAGLGNLAILGVVLGALAVTKYQFFVCAALPVVVVVVARRLRMGREEGRLPTVAALLAVPSVLLGAVQFWVGYGSPFPLVGSSRATSAFWTDEAWLAALRGGAGATLAYVGADLGRAATDFFAGGPTFRGFWGEFGWSDTQLVIRNAGTSSSIRAAILAISLLLVALFAIRVARNLARLTSLWRQGRRESVHRLAAADCATPTYLLFIAFMFAFFVYTDDTFYGQGRNWLPLIVPALLAGVVVAPRALPRNLAPALSGILLVGLLAYSALASHYALTSVKERYYGNGRTLVAASLAGRTASPPPPAIESNVDYLLPEVGAVRAGEALAVGGWAGDVDSPDGVLAVYVTIDGTRDVEAVYGDSRDDVVAQTGRPSLAHAGFDLIVPTDGLAPGTHTLTLKVVPREAGRYYAPDLVRTFTVAAG